MSEIAPAALFGPFGPAQLAVLRSWKRAGVATSFVHTVEHPDPRFMRDRIAHYLPVIGATLHQPLTKKLIADELNRWDVKGVVTLAYSSSAYLHELKRDHGLRADVYGVRPDQIPFMNSKLAQNECAAAVGLVCLPTFMLGPDASPRELHLSYPLVARPDNPTHFKPGFKVALLRTEDELNILLRGFKTRAGDIVLQPFKKLPNLVVHGFRTPAGRHGASAAFIVERKYEGVTLSMKPYAVANDFIKKCHAFCDRAGIIGPYHFEFLLDETAGELFFLDFNGRLGGTTGKAYVLGYDEPLSALEAFDHVPAGSVRYAYDGARLPCATSRVALVKAIVCKARNKFTDVDYLPYEGARALLDLLGGFLRWRDEVIDWTDLRGTLAYFYQSYIGN